jgi:hypothetical protein
MKDNCFTVFKKGASKDKWVLISAFAASKHATYWLLLNDKKIGESFYLLGNIKRKLIVLIFRRKIK